MASEIEVCNLALGHLGDDATVASIDPPEGSAQAEHCARFYPIARDTLLQSHGWNFATRRIQLAQMSAVPYGWAYAYARPDGALDVFDIQFPETMDYAQQSYPFVCESDADGNEVIYTDVENAVARYIVQVTDTTKFPPLFTLALSWQLASLLAGPILKGDAGAAEAKRCAQMAQAYLGEAKVADTRQRRVPVVHSASGIVGTDRTAPSNPWGR